MGVKMLRVVVILTPTLALPRRGGGNWFTSPHLSLLSSRRRICLTTHQIASAVSVTLRMMPKIQNALMVEIDLTGFRRSPERRILTRHLAMYG